LQTVPALPGDFRGASTAAEIQVHPNGKYLYATNRGHDSIAVLKLDPANGRMALIEHVSTRGRMPRNFTLDPTGGWLLVGNHDSDNVVVFRVDADTGRLTPAGEPVAVPNPHCERFLPTP
jgi:6-phosphogluconolactonase